jgi:predicted DNA-binding transcriptional regulator AlpA
MSATSIAADPDSALNENHAALLLGVSVRTLQAWRVSGAGPRYCKIGRSVRYSRRELVSFQQAHEVGSTKEASARGDAL